MKAHRKILLALWQQARNQQSWWMFALLGLLFVVPGLVAAWNGGLALWLKVSAAELCLAALIFWMIQFSNLWQQNHPSFARLVPGHLRALRQVLLGLWLALILFLTALLGSEFGQPLAWAIGAAVLLVVTATLLRWPWLWLQSWLLGMVLVWLRPVGLWQALIDTGLQAYQQAPLLFFIGTLTLLAWPLSRLLQAGGPAHRRGYESAKRMRMAMQMRATGRAAPLAHGGRIGIALWRFFNEPQLLWRQYLIRCASPTERSVLARAEMALSGHWSGQLAGLVFFGALALVALNLIQTFTGVKIAEMLKHGGMGMSIGLVSMALGPALGLRAALHASRREQALLMLLPGMPQGAALNHRLARRQLVQFGLSWVGVVLLVLWVFDAPSYGLGFMAAGLPVGLLALRDWSRQRQPTVQAVVIGMFGWMLAGAGLMALERWLGISTWWSGALLLLLTLALGCWRWRKLATYAQAFPVGRWA